MRIRLYDVTRITRTGLVPHSAIDAEDGCKYSCRMRKAEREA